MYESVSFFVISSCANCMLVVASCILAGYMQLTVGHVIQLEIAIQLQNWTIVNTVPLQ